MGQGECLNVLTKKWQTTKKVAEKLNQDTTLAIASLNRLFKNGEIFRRDRKNKLGYEWKK